jgi:uncharacterized protein (DUF2249 family)
MKINRHTKISVLIKNNQGAIEAIASINPHFNKLRNPILRRVLAPRVTIADAARIGKCTVKDMMDALESIGFEVEDTVAQLANTDASINISVVPSTVDVSKLRVLDVRPILDSGKDPFKRIMEEVSHLPEGHTLEVINSFEPTPLIRILEKKGYKSHVRSEDDMVITSFTSSTVLSELDSPDKEINMLTKSEMETKKLEFAERLNEVDVHLLEMPLPMVTILDQLENLPDGYALYVYHKKVPRFLLPELEERGFKIWMAELAENDVRLLIHR